MASLIPFQTLLPRTCSSTSLSAPPSSASSISWRVLHTNNKRKTPSMVVAAVGDLSSDSTTYLIAGAIGVALVGTAFPILFSRKDACPECDGAGFVRRSGATLRANAARKDEDQIVCALCSGLGKLNQIDK
ncbi:hypothetical protein K1719_012791 [Acacia pycnantha]|nr:hypothetical protein K1719_012791 [Acacia pycnantha]